MAKQAHKTHKGAVPLKTTSPKPKKYTKLDLEAEKVEEDLLEMEEESIQDTIHAAEALDVEAGITVDIGTNVLKAWSEFGSLAAGTMREMNAGVMGNWMQLCSGYTEACQNAFMGQALGKNAGLCNNPFLQQMMGGYFEESAKLYKMWLDGITGPKS